MANKKAKASKESASKDVIIEGEVSARDDKAPASHKPAPQKTNVTGSIFAMLFSVMALGVASFVIYERQSSADAIDEKLGLFAAQMAMLQKQTQAQAQAQAEKTASVEVALQEAILAKPETNLATNQRQAAGFIALMMWQDMRNGQALDDYQPFIMTLSDDEAKARLTNVIAAWQALDYQGLLAQGRGFLNDRPARLGDGSDEGNGDKIAQEDIQEEGILSGVSKWIAAVVKLESLETQQQVSKQQLTEQKLPPQQITEQASAANAYGLDEILGATATHEGPEIAAWREAIKKVDLQQARLSALVIDYLTDEAIMP